MTLVLETGARGAIGRHVVALAKARGLHVVGLGHGGWNDADLPDIDLWIDGAINGDNLASIMHEVGPPDVIVHLAGGSHVGHSITHPGEDFRRTVESSQRLLEWVRCFASSARLVVASSAAVYGAGRSGLIGEDAPLNPNSPYGTHKAVMEMLSCCYGRQYGINIAIVRLFSVYGPGLRKQLIWDLVQRLSRGERQLALGGTGEEMRDFVSIADAAAMLLNASALAGTTTPAFNGCTGRAADVAEIARLVARPFAGAKFAFSGAMRVGDPLSLVGDPARARASGLTPVATLELEIARTVAWIRGALTNEAR